MNIKTTLGLLVILAVFTSCNGQKKSTQVELEPTADSTFNTDSLLEAVRYLSSDELKGRRAGEPEMDKARAYIISKFKEHDVEPLIEGYEQPYIAERRGKTYPSKNVLGLIKGSEFPDKYIVLSAHYDHEGIKNGEIYNGADDNASGTSALFSFAEYLKQNAPRHSVILAAFDAEELGLLGAVHYANNSVVELENIVANLNMDMISRSDTNTLWVVGPRYYEQMRPLVPVTDSTETYQVKIGHEGLDSLPNWTNSSDQAAFHKKNIPFLFFTVDDHPDYHKPTDDFENIDPEFYFKSVSTIISVFEKLDDTKF